MSLILDVVRRDLSHRRPNTAAAGLSRSKSEKDVTPYRPKTSHLQVREAFPARQLSPRSEEKQNQCKKNYGLYEQFLGTPCMPVPSIQTTRNPFASYEPRQPDKVRWKKLEETHRRKTATKDNGASARDTSISSQEKSMIKFRKQAGKFGVEQLGEQYHELKNKVWENYHTKAHKGARRRISVRIRSGSTIGLNDRRLEFVGDLQGSKGGEGGLMAVGGAIEKARAQRQAKLKQEHRNGFNYHESVFYQPSGDEKPLNNRSHQSKRGDRYDIKERSTHKNHYSKHQNQAVLHKHSNSVAPTSLTWGGTLKQIMPQGAEITQSVNQGEAAEAYLGKEAQQIEDLENEELFYEQLVSSGLEVFHLEGKDRTSRLKRHVDHRRRQRAALKKEREIERMRQRHLEALRKENERAMALELDVDAGVDVDLDRGGNEGNVFSAHAESSGAAARHTRLNYSSSSHQLRRYGVDTGGEMGGEHKHEHKNNNKHNNEHETRNGQGNGHGREKGMVKSYSLAVLDLHRQKMNELVPRSHRGFKPTGVTGLGSKQIRYSILQRDRIRSRKEALLAKTESHLTKLMQAMGEEVEQKKQLLGDGDDVPYWQREPEVGSESSKTEEDGAEKGGQANDSDAHVKNRKTETNKGESYGSNPISSICMHAYVHVSIFYTHSHTHTLRYIRLDTCIYDRIYIDRHGRICTRAFLKYTYIQARKEDKQNGGVKTPRREPRRKAEEKVEERRTIEENSEQQTTICRRAMRCRRWRILRAWCFLQLSTLRTKKWRRCRGESWKRSERRKPTKKKGERRREAESKQASDPSPVIGASSSSSTHTTLSLFPALKKQEKGKACLLAHSFLRRPPPALSGEASAVS